MIALPSQVDSGGRHRLRFHQGSPRSGADFADWKPGPPFVLQTDASGKAIGAFLEQVGVGVECGSLLKDVIQAGTNVPVAFLSRKLTDSQDRTWDVRDKEA